MTPAQSPPHLRHPPFHDQLPAPIYFRLESMPDNATYPVMQHPWGEFVYSFSGITELRLAGEHLLARVPWGARVEVTLDERGAGFAAPADGPVYDQARAAFAEQMASYTGQDLACDRGPARCSFRRGDEEITFYGDDDGLATSVGGAT